MDREKKSQGFEIAARETSVGQSAARLGSPPYVRRNVWRRNLNKQLVGESLAEKQQAQEVTGSGNPVADDWGVSRDKRKPRRWGNFMAGQIERALEAIDHVGESKYQAKQEQGWQPGEAVEGPYNHGYKNTVFDRAITLTHWLREEYPQIRLFCEVDREMISEFLSEKAETCTPDTVRTLLATLKKL